MLHFEFYTEFSVTRKVVNMAALHTRTPAHADRVLGKSWARPGSTRTQRVRPFNAAANRISLQVRQASQGQVVACATSAHTIPALSAKAVRR